jgi:trimeric autotransporter adhesin
LTAFDKKGNVYISDVSGRVRKVDIHETITTFAGNGSNIVSGDGGPATAAGIGPGAGLCIDASGNVYIGAGNRIRKVDTNGIISTFAGTIAGDGGLATAAKFHTDGQLAIDGSGNFYIADASNNRVRKISTDGTITTFAGSGTVGHYGYSGDGGPATAAQLHGPNGVFADNCGNVYIADTWNNVIRVVNGPGIIKAFAGNGFGAGGLGTGAFSGDNGRATAAELNFPSAVYLDRHQNVYIFDSYNDRVRFIRMDSCRNTTDVPVTPQVTDVAVYPNPAESFLFIDDGTLKIDRYVIRNPLGYEILTGPLNKSTRSVNVEQLPTGTYVISFYRQNVPAGNKVFVKK